MFLSACLVTGCATPEYLMPTGYSSTYQKALSVEIDREQEMVPLAEEVFEHASEETAILR